MQRFCLHHNADVPWLERSPKCVGYCRLPGKSDGRQFGLFAARLIGARGWLLDKLIHFATSSTVPSYEPEDERIDSRMVKN